MRDSQDRKSSISFRTFAVVAVAALAVRIGLVLSFEGREIFPDCARLTFGLSPDDLFGCLAMVATSVGLHDAGVDGEPFALDQTG